MRVTGANWRRGLLSLAAVVLLVSGCGIPGSGVVLANPNVAQEDGHETEAAQAEAHEVGSPGAQATGNGEEDHGAEVDQAEAHPVGPDEHRDVEHGEEEHGETWLQIGFRWINFFLLLAVMWWLLVVPPGFVIETFSFPGLKVLLRERGKGIIESRDLANLQVAEAAEIVQVSTERLERISEEVDALLDEARADAEQELARAETAGAEAAERVKGTGARDLASREGSAVRDLRAHAADAVVDLARRVLSEHFRGEDQERLVRAYLDQLGEQVR